MSSKYTNDKFLTVVRVCDGAETTHMSHMQSKHICIPGYMYVCYCYTVTHTICISLRIDLHEYECPSSARILRAHDLEFRDRRALFSRSLRLCAGCRKQHGNEPERKRQRVQRDQRVDEEFHPTRHTVLSQHVKIREASPDIVIQGSRASQKGNQRGDEEQRLCCPFAHRSRTAQSGALHAEQRRRS